MKLLLVSQEYPPETGWGGIGTYTWMLGQGLIALGHDVHVLSVAPGVDPSSKTCDSVMVHRRPLRQLKGVGRLTGLRMTYEQLALSWSVWRNFRRLHLENRFDLVEFPNWKAEGFFFFRHKPIPSSMRLHSMGFQLMPLMGLGARDRSMATKMEEYTVRRVDVAHAPEQHLRMVSERLDLAKHRTRVIPAPVMVPADPGPPPQGPPRVLFAGRFEPRKNPEVIVRSIPKVIAEIPEARFVFVGRDSAAGGHDSYQAWLKGIVSELGVDASVDWVDGWQPDGVSQQMPLASVVVVPSRSESFGYVAAEGSSYGRPVIVSKVNGLSWIVADGKTGLHADAEDVDQWSEALIQLLQDRDKAVSMGRAGRAFVEQTLAPKVVAAQMEKAYIEAIENFRSATASAPGR